MSNTLIINGANFALAAATHEWLFGLTDFSVCTQAYKTGTVFRVVSDGLRNKAVSKVKFKCGAAGTITLYSCTATKVGGTTTQIGEITCDATDVGNVVEKDVSFILGDSLYLGVEVDADGVIDYEYDTSLDEYHTQLYSSTTAGNLLSGRDLYMDFYVS